MKLPVKLPCLHSPENLEHLLHTLLLEVPVEFGATGDRVTGILSFCAKASMEHGVMFHVTGIIPACICYGFLILIFRFMLLFFVAIFSL